MLKGFLYFDGSNFIFHEIEQRPAVKSVGLSVPDEFVSLERVTNEGDLSFESKSLAPGLFYATPADKEGKLHARTLTSQDLPIVDVEHGGTGSRKPIEGFGLMIASDGAIRQAPNGVGFPFLTERGIEYLTKIPPACFDIAFPEKKKVSVEDVEGIERLIPKKFRVSEIEGIEDMLPKPPSGDSNHVVWGDGSVRPLPSDRVSYDVVNNGFAFGDIKDGVGCKLFFFVNSESDGELTLRATIGGKVAFTKAVPVLGMSEGQTLVFDMTFANRLNKVFWEYDGSAHFIEAKPSIEVELLGATPLFATCVHV